MGVENNECVIAITWNHNAIEEIKNWIQNNVPEKYRDLFVFIPALENGKKNCYICS